MREKIVISEFNVQILIEGKVIECYDQITKNLLDSKILNYPIERVIQQKDFDNLLLIDAESNKYNLQVMLVREISHLKTNAEYILNLQMDTPNHGYYFGLYEIGEFSLKESNVNLNCNFSLKYCNTGIYIPKGIIFLSIRESEPKQGSDNYFLYKINWLHKSGPVILWKKPISSSIQKMLLKDDVLLLGLKNGNLQIFDLKNEEYLENLSLFQSSVSVMSEGKDKILVASCNGEVAAISRNWSIIWKTRLSKNSIYGLIEINNSIQCIDITGKFFLLNQKTGIIQHKEQYNLNPSIYSNAVILRGWIILNDGMGVQAINRDYKRIISYQIEGPLSDSYIREFRSHSKGIITGDDGGVIRLWRFGQLKLPLLP